MTYRTDRWIQFAFSHQTLIIEGLFVVILAVIVLWLIINLNRENDKESAQPVRVVSSDLEDTLKKLLENQKAGGAPATSAAAAGSPSPSVAAAPKTAPVVSIFGGPAAAAPAPAPQIFSAPVQTPDPLNAMIPQKVVEQAPTQAMKPAAKTTPEVMASFSDAPAKPAATSSASDADLLKAKENLEAQNKRINELLASLDQTRADLKKANDELAKSGDTEELRARIATLEARLQEYEVIEDDIANLSIYKKENEELKREIQALKNGEGAQSATPNWPINNPEPARALMPVEMKKSDVVAEEAGAQEGEKLLQEFQKFMKGSRNG